MAKYYVTVSDSMTQATTTFTAVQTLPDGGTLSTIKVPPGMKKISVIGTCLTHDGAAVIDTGNAFFLQFSGTGMVDGIQEVVIGGLMSQETGTSVTGTYTHQPAVYRNVDINVKAGEITVAAAYNGTDGGSPFVAVTLGFE
ncbi:MAG: hypothetical protein QMD85_01440 [Candidatus Aenigmarchaeota archaeon]|nr:hypothetical protein [Candidatus Aenigmarchaeota archaeon]